jgi:type VII secretion protein EccB
MQTRRDHVQAYHYGVSRLASALTGADPGTGEAPFRRAAFGATMGALLACLAVAAALVIGFLDPAPAATWKQQQSIVVEKETGTRYIYLNGQLHPTLNYTSARLLAGASAVVDYLPRSALASVPVGATIGIPDAPENLPLASALLPGRWRLCLAPGRPDGLTLDLLGGAAPGLGDERVLVAGPDGAQYVIWGNTKYPLPQQSDMIAMGFGNSNPVPAPATWLSALRTGPALAPPRVARAGQPGPSVAGQPARIGALFQSVAGGVTQYYVLLSDGLAPVSRTEFALLAAAPGAAPATQVSPAALAAAPASANRKLLDRLPGLLPGALYQPGTSGTTLCTAESSGGRPGTATVVTEPASSAGVEIAPGAGMLVQAPSPVTAFGALPQQQYLITNSGLKYPLGQQAASALGYGSAAVRVMPVPILALLPVGPLLSAAMASQTVSWSQG